MQFKSLVWRCCLAAVVIGTVGGMAGCESAPTAPAEAPVLKSELQFLDMQSFDRELSQALSAPLPKVDVIFYDQVTPSALPERLQNWLTSVEDGGGRIKVTPPKSDVTAKDPFLLMSLVSSLWSATKMTKAALLNSQFKVARSYDAEIILRENDKGQNVVDKLVFVMRPAPKP